MATSPNFNWPEPDNTDLVKNGALAIRTAVNAIDTSLVDLKGGTTGQVLKKNSNTDMDFVWSADSAGMTNPMTTTGDTIYSSSGSTPARLGIGSTGQVLTVASGIPSWATPAGGGALTLITPSSTANSGGTVTTSGAEVSASGVTSVSLNGVFTSTYKNYIVAIYQATMNTPSGAMLMRLRASGTDTAGTVYYGTTAYALFGGTGGYGGINGGANFDITNVSTSPQTAASVWLQSPQLAAQTNYQTIGSRTDGSGTGGGYLNNTTAYDGFTLLVGANTLTCKVVVYGLSN